MYKVIDVFLWVVLYVIIFSISTQFGAWYLVFIFFTAVLHKACTLNFNRRHVIGVKRILSALLVQLSLVFFLLILAGFIEWLRQPNL
ncbi:hypothetical protein DS2_17552 [Catenovulum agarivorans DS-2]|uniref:Uncharacterized protein n=1 Tax=Catenovulum agarivorans DS-2 TaxID=1328313 RepID=W7QSR6_9ALTE|nr:hypothetical protein [Catenovulum agarivorans]EWH08430.1 hypothetical protein DS2_17552 [Catenovulum agarivorans DS-2]